MIFDRLCNLDRYRGLSPDIDRGMDFLQSADLTALPLGRVEIAGDEVYGNHFTYTTTPLTQGAQFEAHQRYLDLHVILTGIEKVALAPVETLEPTEIRAGEDAIIYRGASKDVLTLEQGAFLLVFPSEGHLPKLAAGTAADVDKLVLKIAY
ncbi:beta-D-galactosidase [Oscillospiraceae bacterium]|nr:beta-D-galactosidase [Oscillospiraceae bacterium]BDF76789.1 beta-D-galactosidase [Oscillospiraceae bacterium]